MKRRGVRAYGLPMARSRVWVLPTAVGDPGAGYAGPTLVPDGLDLGGGHRPLTVVRPSLRIRVGMTCEAQAPGLHC